MEDEVASGSNSSEIAKMLNVKLLTLNNVTKQKLANNKILSNVADAIFALEEHETSYPLDVSSKMLIIVSIQKSFLLLLKNLIMYLIKSKKNGKKYYQRTQH
ncbi:peptidyl-prolyl cis-trans isomerase D domain protein [Orientia tsutsugamushi str. Gilliam]|uniref:Peptidyl-prolyl cis-trans isomerase D domain protein n=1 Tax=Orientia tsutsugamushi str. Gilliam TaxID=1359184 RepID=A0A0F3ME89_ORITS|nr:hypothetical protein [Orientia tsutsugamushi]KJV53797.1 peptidyl-prolyl cis-trans isomerase D domain protein [Orientia tsutsugamushi str. Gilliam]